jgi:hypothetical protein
MTIEFKKIMLETLQKSWKGSNWETAFCQSCGVDLDGFHSFCDVCERNNKIDKILKK